MPVAGGDAEDDDVGAGADRGGVAAQVGAQGERPPQRRACGVAVPAATRSSDDRRHRGDVRDVVHDADSTADPNSSPCAASSELAADGVGGLLGELVR